MAKHRKFFPASGGQNNTAAAASSCLSVRNQACPYACDPYPIFYYTSPPPPLWPSPPPPPPSPASSASTNQGSKHVPFYVIILAIVLSTLFLLVTYYVIFIKHCSNWNIFRARWNQSRGTRDEEFVDENHSPTIDHPIWYINTIGLQPSVINSITIFKYKKGEGLIEGSTCTVCLSEFRDDETLRLLPECNHAFHINCIDTWLRSHTNCPLCRAGIVPNTPNSQFPENQNTNSMNSDQDNQVERNDEDLENRVRTEDDAEVGHESHDDALGGCTILMEEEEIIPVRRSVSMDMISTPRTDNLAIESEGSSGIFRMMRSFSQGGRSFLTKHHRNSNSILPL